MTSLSPDARTAPLRGRTALVTGAASGIGGPSPAGSPRTAPRSSPSTGTRRRSPRSPTRSARTRWSIDLSDIAALPAAVATSPAASTSWSTTPESSTWSGSNDSRSRPSRRSSRIMLTAPFVLTRAVLPGMYERGWGRIIHVSSAHGRRASPFKVAYVTAKHGLEGLYKVIALEGAEQGVTSNCINPGYVRTPLVEAQIADQAVAHGISETRCSSKVILAVVPGETADRAGGSRLRPLLPVLAGQRVHHRLRPGPRRRLGRPLTPAARVAPTAPTGDGSMAPMGLAQGVPTCWICWRGTPRQWSSNGRWSRPAPPVCRAADIEKLEQAKRVALGVREQLEAHRRREAELAALFQTASDLAALTSVDDVLAAIVRRARALLGRDIAYLCLNDEERGDTYMRVTDGSVSAEFQAVRLPLGAGPRRPGRAAGRPDRRRRLLPRRTVPAHRRPSTPPCTPRVWCRSSASRSNAVPR